MSARSTDERQGGGGAVGAPDFGAPRTFLITGATGFIGRKLVGVLLEAGHQVTVLTRQPREASRMFMGRTQCIDTLDQLDPARRIDIVINLAGAPVLGPRWSAARKAALRESRTGLTGRLVAWIGRAEHKPALVLSASAIGYYGVQPEGDDSVLTEDAPAQPIFMSDLCREWEQAARGAEAYGVPVAYLRIGVVLGLRGALPKMLLPIKLGLGGPLGGGRQWLSWIHVEDVIGAMAHLCRHGGTGPYNLTAPEAHTQAQFSLTAAKVWRRPHGFPTPALPVRLLLGEQAGLLLQGQRVAPARLIASAYAFRHPTLEGALRDLAA